MPEWNKIDESQLRDLAAWLVGLPWPLDEATIAQLAEARGWTVVSDKFGFEWDTGLPLNRPEASATTPDGEVSDLRVKVAPILLEKTAQSKAFLRDVFADHVRLLTEMLGEPREREPGALPAVRWVLSSGAEFAVRLGSSGCTWAMTSPKFVQIEAEVD